MPYFATLPWTSKWLLLFIGTDTDSDTDIPGKATGEASIENLNVEYSGKVCLVYCVSTYEFIYRFLPCDALRCTVFVIVILSVCPSVRPSVTLVDCVHMVRPTIMISSPYGSTVILVSGDIKFIPKFEWDHPERGR